MTKKAHLTLRITDKDAAQIAAHAADAGVTVSAWLRQAVDRAAAADQLADQLAELAALRDELRSDVAGAVADLDGKLKIISDQIAALSRLIIEGKK